MGHQMLAVSMTKHAGKQKAGYYLFYIHINMSFETFIIIISIGSAIITGIWMYLAFYSTLNFKKEMKLTGITIILLLLMLVLCIIQICNI